MRDRGTVTGSSGRGGLWLQATTVLMLAGCTMCPDPFDYSGPVPNGSSPQNDFRARSGGILPVGGTGRPWPGMVQGDASGERTEEPLPVLAEQEAGSGDDPAAMRRTGGFEEEIAEDMSVEPVPAAIEASGVDLEQLSPNPDHVEQPSVPSSESPGQAAPSTEMPAPVPLPDVAAETPGWRPRR